ncbi:MULTISPECIES: plasmid mobilization relaxase MbeA [Enterobacter cloacae complex]|uniref:plasmid mobilization relaxase MbeA n=1 Tax=Enterobacter cloacae complex TaxID=354276 RepID=UPI0005099705|nr:DNA polymerase [Enterobacter hormaechei subsp. steigerwaltii]
MIVKFHPRGRGGGAGPVDYLLGKDRQREGATVLQGRPEEVRELIDASPYAKKYTSGVLSFAEADLPPGQREKLMASFERVLMPGLDKDQYSVLWVEHTDKGRLELNFLIPNTELLTGKRLQPYFDRADRPRIDAWQTVVNGRLGLHDPNAPENRRALVTASALPETKQEAAQAITQGLLALASSGELKTRQDVTAALESAGFEVVRTTRSSISIADPDGGRNIRLKGAIYEQSFNAGEGLGAEIESAAAAYRRDAESRIQRARAVCQSGTECKREENQRRHPRPRGEYELGHGKEPAERAAHGRADMAHRPDDGRPACRDERERAVVAGPADNRQLHGHSPAGGYAEETHRPDVGRALSGEQRRPEIPYPAAGDAIRSYPLRRDDLDPPETGVAENDRTGKAVAERIRAATAGLLAKAGRVGERLRGMAEDVWAYATGERDAERARVGLERAGAEFERAAAPLVRELNTAERRQREHEYQKSLEQQRQPQKTYKGPTLG